jgi:hypothetical protein
MKLLEAIAFSPGNKAEAMADHGGRVVVQERYGSVALRWYHVWQIYRGQVTTISLPDTDLERLKTFEVDPEADYWSPIGR